MLKSNSSYGCLIKKSILTRDNLLKRGWKGNKNCVFCGQDETIDHLFFSCSVVRLIWNLLRCAFDLHSMPVDIHDCFDRWIKLFPKKDKRLVLVGCAVLGSVEM